MEATHHADHHDHGPAKGLLRWVLPLIIKTSERFIYGLVLSCFCLQVL